MAGPDYIVEIDGLRLSAGGGSAGDRRPSFRDRPWLAVHWRCCRVYSRLYRNAAATAYDGRCPTCGRPVHIAIAQDGTDARFFEAI